MGKIKVAWICSFNNAKTREFISYKGDFLGKFLSRFSKWFSLNNCDTAIWNVNAIEEFKKFDDVEVHVICPVRHLNSKLIEYTEDNIHYHFIREQHSNSFRFILHNLFTRYSSKFKSNRRRIKQVLKRVNPDLIHVMGAENPFYSLALLDVAEGIPSIIQLQALLCRIADVTKVPAEKKGFAYKGRWEHQLIRRADYIGTKLPEFRKYITQYIKPEARFLDISLHMGQNFDFSLSEKKFDFVYFSVNISKAGLEALEAFILAHRKYPDITLDFVGGYDETFREILDARIRDAGIENSVFFEGRLPTHDDVISQIRKARFALMPLKMDFIPNTIHEALANGLPVVTTVTDGTPSLNNKRETVLLSLQDDFEAMAKNMGRLLDDPQLAESLIKSGFETEKEFNSNEDIARNWLKSYKELTGK